MFARPLEGTLAPGLSLEQKNPFGTKGAVSPMCLPLAERHTAQFSEVECEANLR